MIASVLFALAVAAFAAPQPEELVEDLAPPGCGQCRGEKFWCTTMGGQSGCADTATDCVAADACKSASATDKAGIAAAVAAAKKKKETACKHIQPLNKPTCVSSGCAWSDTMKCYSGKEEELIASSSPPGCGQCHGEKFWCTTIAGPAGCTDTGKDCVAVEACKSATKADKDAADKEVAVTRKKKKQQCMKIFPLNKPTCESSGCKWSDTLKCHSSSEELVEAEEEEKEEEEDDDTELDEEDEGNWEEEEEEDDDEEDEDEDEE
jgi:hypothetical protein